MVPRVVFFNREKQDFERAQGSQIQAAIGHQTVVFNKARFQNEVAETPLAQRSWAFQERFSRAEDHTIFCVPALLGMPT